MIKKFIYYRRKKGTRGNFYFARTAFLLAIRCFTAISVPLNRDLRASEIVVCRVELQKRDIERNYRKESRHNIKSRRFGESFIPTSWRLYRYVVGYILQKLWSSLRSDTNAFAESSLLDFSCRFVLSFSAKGRTKIAQVLLLSYLWINMYISVINNEEIYICTYCIKTLCDLIDAISRRIIISFIENKISYNRTYIHTCIDLRPYRLYRSRE